jgi:hypothetical protein
MAVYKIDPLRDPRWPAFLQRHSSASIFHTPAWLECLRRTYAYQPVVYTTARPDEELRNGLPVCQVDSWLTGRRIVSLPFSDHCEPLIDTDETLRILVSSLVSDAAREDWKYLELRPQTGFSADLETHTRLSRTQYFRLHRIDLRPEVATLLQQCHKSSVRRKLNRAESERLKYEVGVSDTLLKKFYYLLLLTRRRHRVPPQPLIWFQNLIDCCRGVLSIRVVSKDDRPIAGDLTLSFRKSVVSKYACSDERCHYLGGVPLVLWKAMQEYKSAGAIEYDLGRTELSNSGLIAFKENWGAISTTLSYYRYPGSQKPLSDSNWQMRMLGRVVAHCPNDLLQTAGKLLYRHIG